MNLLTFPRISLHIRWGYAGVLVLLLSLPACQSGEIPLTRFEDSPVIDRLLASAPHFVANTDIEPERWVATTRLGLPTDSLILSSSMHMMAIGDSVYISEMFGNNIFAVGADGYLSRKIGAKGKAPGEFISVMGMAYNGSHIFVKDSERVQMFTEKFEYIASFHSFDALLRRFSVSPDYIFLQCLENDWLVCPHSTSPPYSSSPGIKFLPVLDFPGQSGENANLVTASPGGEIIAMAYRALPYIFIYDDQFRHLKTIRFAGERVRNFDSPAPPPDGSPPGMEPGTRSFVMTIKFLDSRHLLVSSRGVYVFDLSENDYQLAKKIIFQPFDDTEGRRDIQPADFLLHGDHLYVSSPWEEYVYGYEFDLE